VGLAILGSFLVGGLAAISSATVREGKLDAGAEATDARKRKGHIAALAAFGLIALVLTGGKLWWDSESDVYRKRVYRPLNMQAHLQGHQLTLDLSEPGWMQGQTRNRTGALNRILFVRKMDDLVLDHDHLMHLYVIRQPGLDVLYHLHPDQLRSDEFGLALPAMPAGDYKLYADVVHENGLPETLASSLHLADDIGPDARPLAGDDARVETQPAGLAGQSDTFVLPDGYRMRWLHGTAPLHAREGTPFEFELLTPGGTPAPDMQLYMGMLGHAAFVKTDGTVFAHIHPNGTVAMSAFMLAQGKSHEGMQMAGMPADMSMGSKIPNKVSFPYGVPSPGAYRIFVQMKHAGIIETGVFDTKISD
jgi:hypothetical protein